MGIKFDLFGTGEFKLKKDDEVQLKLKKKIEEIYPKLEAKFRASPLATPDVFVPFDVRYIQEYGDVFHGPFEADQTSQFTFKGPVAFEGPVTGIPLGMTEEERELLYGLEKKVDLLSEEIKSPEPTAYMDQIDFVEDITADSSYGVEVDKLTLPFSEESPDVYLTDSFDGVGPLAPDSSKWITGVNTTILDNKLELRDSIETVGVSFGKKFQIQFDIGIPPLQIVDKVPQVQELIVTLKHNFGGVYVLKVGFSKSRVVFSLYRGTALLSSASIEQALDDFSLRNLVLIREGQRFTLRFDEEPLFVVTDTGTELGDTQSILLENNYPETNPIYLDNFVAQAVEGKKVYELSGIITTKSGALKTANPVKEVVVNASIEHPAKLVTVGAATQFEDQYDVETDWEWNTPPSGWTEGVFTGKRYSHREAGGYLWVLHDTSGWKYLGLDLNLDLTTLTYPIIITVRLSNYYAYRQRVWLQLLNSAKTTICYSGGYQYRLECYGEKYFGYMKYPPDGGSSYITPHLLNGVFHTVKIVINSASSSDWYFFDENETVLYRKLSIPLIAQPGWFRLGFSAHSYGYALFDYVKVETGTSITEQFPTSASIDLSLDGGVNWISGITLSQLIDVTGAPFGGQGNNAVVRINMSTTDSQYSPKVRQVSVVTRTVASFVKAKINEMIDVINAQHATNIAKL